jgi:phospholipase/carboxylesterase
MTGATMREETIELAGLRTIVVSPREPQLVVVMLHGYAMRPEDLAPFAHSLKVPAVFLVPEAPLAARPSGHAWWEMDHDRRASAPAEGPRDLHAEHPVDTAAARAGLLALLEESARRWNGCGRAIVGFSQGGMLACDTLLRNQPDVAMLALLSASRITADEWLPLVHRLRDLPVLVSHGRKDTDLAFGAGSALRDLLQSGGARVTWVPHNQGHEIPLVVWRALRKFLTSCRAEVRFRRPV